MEAIFSTCALKKIGAAAVVGHDPTLLFSFDGFRKDSSLSLKRVV